MNNIKDLERVSASVPGSYYSERSDAPKFRPQPLIDGDKSEVKPYSMEFVEESCNVPDAEETNALGMKANWYEEGRRQIEEPKPPEEEKVAAITLEELEAIRKEAYDDGFAEGKEQGFATGHKEGYEAGVAAGTRDGFVEGQAEGLKNGQEIVAGEAARFCRYANHLVDPISKLDTELSSELIYLAGRLARAFIKQEVKVNPAYLEQAIADVSRLLPAASTNVSFRLNPQDCRLVADTLSTADLKIFPDPNLKPGDIAADAEMSSIDIRLEERIDHFLAEFMNLNSDKAELAPKNSEYVVDHTYDGVNIDAPAQVKTNTNESANAIENANISPSTNSQSEALMPRASAENLGPNGVGLAEGAPQEASSLNIGTVDPSSNVENAEVIEADAPQTSNGNAQASSPVTTVDPAQGGISAKRS